MPSARHASIASLTERYAKRTGSIDAVVPAGNHAMDRVIALGQSIYIRGWAIDAPAATLASRVVLIVDEAVEYLADYGKPRQDIANFFGDPGLAKSGFEAVLPPLQTVGDHRVAAYAVSLDGRSYLAAGIAAFHVIPSLIPRPFAARPSKRGDGEIIAIHTDGDERTSLQLAGRTELTFDAGVVVRGWAQFRGKPATEIGVVVDDRWFLEANADPGAPPDGFQARFVLNFALPGEHMLYAVARRGMEPFVRVSEPITFESIETPLPWIRSLVELRQETRAVIEEIRVRGVPAAGPLELLRGLGIFIRGWAVDDPAGGPPGGVYFRIDGNKDEAVPARNARYVLPITTDPFEPGLCRFTALIPTDTLSRGRHRLELLVAGRGWAGYYAPLQPIEFNICRIRKSYRLLAVSPRLPRRKLPA